MNSFNGLTDGVYDTVSLATWALSLGHADMGWAGDQPVMDWSRGLIVAESDAVHNWSKGLGGAGLGVFTGGTTGKVLSGVTGKLKFACPPAGATGGKAFVQKAASWITGGGCFAAGTPVWMADPVRGETKDATGGVATAARVGTKRAIESVALGSRVIASNPRPLDYDYEFAEPTEWTRHEWRRVDLEVTHDDGRSITLALLRPVDWLVDNRVRPGATIVLPKSELGPAAAARVARISDCPPIDAGEGEVVTGQSVTTTLDDEIDSELGR